MNTAYAYAHMAEYDKVRLILERYRNSYRDNGVIHNYFLELHLYAGEYDEALKEAEISISLEPENPNWVADKSNLYLLTGEWDKAEKILRELLEWEEAVAQLIGRWQLYWFYLHQVFRLKVL